jgi:hypothetical protein
MRAPTILWQSAEPHCPTGLDERCVFARGRLRCPPRWPLVDERAATRGRRAAYLNLGLLALAVALGGARARHGAARAAVGQEGPAAARVFDDLSGSLLGSNSEKCSSGRRCAIHVENDRVISRYDPGRNR